MIDIRNYIKKGFLQAIGNMPEYKIRLNSAGWYEKGVLFEEDLGEIEKAIEEHDSPIAKSKEVITENQEGVTEEYKAPITEENPVYENEELKNIN